MNERYENRKIERCGLHTLKGIGITGIVLYHLFPFTFRGGFLGISLFFVLSGYLMFITSDTRLSNGSFQFQTYYKKRFLKIFPPLFAMIVVICCYLTLFERDQLAGMRGEICSIFLGYDNLWQIRQNASYFSKMANASPFTHLWFLSLEIQFYLLWPLLFLLYQKCRSLVSGKILCFLFLALALISAGRMFFLYTPGEDPSRVYYGTDTMAFPLLTGIFLGAFRCEYPGFRLNLKKKKIACFFFGLSVAVISILFLTVDGQSDFVYQGGLFGISIFFALMVCLFEDNRQWFEDILETSLITLLGKKSYWLYLWHYPIAILAF